MATRIRRGKVVDIPEEWLHVVTTRGTLKDRREARIMTRAERKKRLRHERDFDFQQSQV